MASIRDKDDEGPTCDICMDEYNTRQRRPVLLGCFHTLCLSCAQMLHRKGAIVCPSCRRSTLCPDGPSALPRDPSIELWAKRHRSMKQLLEEELALRKEMQLGLDQTVAQLRRVLAEVEARDHDNRAETEAVEAALLSEEDAPTPHSSASIRRQVERVADARTAAARQRQEETARLRVDVRDATDRRTLAACSLFDAGFSARTDAGTEALAHLVFSVLLQSKDVTYGSRKASTAAAQDPTFDADELASFRLELAQLGNNQREELAELAASVRSQLAP